jgi:hypothetical protein
MSRSWWEGRFVCLVLVAGCGPADPPNVPGPAGVVHGRVIRKDQPVAGVHALTRITAGPPCRVTNRNLGGTSWSTTPTDSTGWFKMFANRNPGDEQTPGCLYVGAVNPATAETVWAAPRPAPTVEPGPWTGKYSAVLEIDVPWDH